MHKYNQIKKQIKKLEKKQKKQTAYDTAHRITNKMSVYSMSILIILFVIAKLVPVLNEYVTIIYILIAINICALIIGNFRSIFYN